MFCVRVLCVLMRVIFTAESSHSVVCVHAHTHTFTASCEPVLNRRLNSSKQDADRAGRRIGVNAGLLAAPFYCPLLPPAVCVYIYIAKIIITVQSENTYILYDCTRASVWCFLFSHFFTLFTRVLVFGQVSAKTKSQTN